jgi:hypothetical protein
MKLVVIMIIYRYLYRYEGFVLCVKIMYLFMVLILYYDDDDALLLSFYVN